MYWNKEGYYIIFKKSQRRLTIKRSGRHIVKCILGEERPREARQVVVPGSVPWGRFPRPRDGKNDLRVSL